MYIQINPGKIIRARYNSKVKKYFSTIVLTIIVIASGLFTFKDQLSRLFFKPTDSGLTNQELTAEQTESISVVGQNLETPWALAFLPGGDILVTERPGTLKRIGQNGQTYKIEGVKQTSEGGLLGLALHPNFEQNNWLYLYLTSSSGDQLVNRVERYTYADDSLGDRTVIIDQIPGAANHDGGRIAFGPDGYLYAATGDAGVAENAQDTDSLAGKILRMTDEGKVPTDNPFSNYVYSYGHRNPQGLAWDDQGRLWSTEHGPSGLETGNDELNLIEKGANYGWPTIRGEQFLAGMKTPVLESGKEETWAPASLTFIDGSLFFAGLRGQTLYQAKIGSNNEVNLSAHLRNEHGRLRTVQAHNGALYMTTSNTDGRGDPAATDDKILKLPLALFR